MLDLLDKPDSFRRMGFARCDLPEAVVYSTSVRGYGKKDISIEVRDRRVIVRGERTEGFLRPRSRRSFVESFTLPETLDEQDVSADLRDDVLSLTVAKKPEARARRIPILVDGKAVPAFSTEKQSAADSGSFWRRLGGKWFASGASAAST